MTYTVHCFVTIVVCSYVQIRECLETLDKPRIVELESDEHRALDVRRNSLPSSEGDGDASETTAVTLNCLPANYVVMRD